MPRHDGPNLGRRTEQPIGDSPPAIPALVATPQGPSEIWIGRQQIPRAASTSIGKIHKIINDREIVLGIINGNGCIARRRPSEAIRCYSLGPTCKLREVRKVTFSRSHRLEGIERGDSRAPLIQIDAWI